MWTGSSKGIVKKYFQLTVSSDDDDDDANKGNTAKKNFFMIWGTNGRGKNENR